MIFCSSRSQEWFLWSDPNDVWLSIILNWNLYNFRQLIISLYPSTPQKTMENNIYNSDCSHVAMFSGIVSCLSSFGCSFFFSILFNIIVFDYCSIHFRTWHYTITNHPGHISLVKTLLFVRSETNSTSFVLFFFIFSSEIFGVRRRQQQLKKMVLSLVHF